VYPHRSARRLPLWLMTAVMRIGQLVARRFGRSAFMQLGWRRLLAYAISSANEAVLAAALRLRAGLAVPRLDRAVAAYFAEPEFAGITFAILPQSSRRVRAR
jgi:hypothetical protein